MTPLDACYYRTRDDELLFERATAGLPQRGVEEPYHCGAHNVRAFRYALWETSCGYKLDLPNGRQVQDVRVFEIGFNLGHSAAVMLELGAANVWSIDNRATPNMFEAAYILHGRHGDNFNFNGPVTVATCAKPAWQPTLAFIDGSHNHDEVVADILYCRDQLGITRFLFDDWDPHWGPGVQSAVYATGLLPLHVMGSMAYCVVAEAEGYFKPEMTI